MVNKPQTGTLMGTRSSDVKRSRGRPPTPKHSPTRNKSPTRTKSPSRKKSPPRKSPSRSKKATSPTPRSPSRGPVATPKARSPLPRSPGRKSPPRVAKSAALSYDAYFKEGLSIREGLRRKSTKIDLDTDSDDTVEIKEKPKAAVRGRSRRDIEDETSMIHSRSLGSTFPTTKRVTRNSQTREEERVVHLKHFDIVAQKLGEFSDEDELKVRKSQSVDKITIKKPTTEFGGTIGCIFFILALPLVTIFLHLICNESQCSFTQIPNWKKFLIPSLYCNTKAFLASVLFLTSLALLSALPVGGRKVTGLPNRQGRLDYIINAPFICVVILSTFIGLELKGIPLADFITDNTLPLLTSFTILGTLLSIYLYIRSFYVPLTALNTHTVNHGAIYAFFMGRELNPRVLKVLDLKIFVNRVALIGSILLDFAFLYKSLGFSLKSVETFDFKSLSYQPTLIVTVLLHTIYFLDPVIREAAWLTSFEIQYESLGYMGAVGYLTYPFMVVLSTKYIMDYQIELAMWKLCLVALVFLLGLILFSGANSQKDAFRKNPYNPALAHLETIPTTQGKKLLVSGFWGIVRHPNYLGDILMNLSMGYLVLAVPPVIIWISIVLLLIHRSVRDNARCKQKYGAAWDRYCSRVKYILVPKVY